MQVRVLYLGMLRDVAGCDHEVIQVAEGSRLGDLYRELQQRLPRLQNFRGALAFALNYEYSSEAAELHENDEVALLPPVSGGLPGQPPGTKISLPLRSAHASLVFDPIDTAAISQALKHPADGALAVFDGIVRDNSRGRRTLYLDYSAYEEMALRQMEQLALQALAQFAVRDVKLMHRLGRLHIGETSVYIAVASAHRAAAFDACRWLIDTLKKTVPIWKKEYFTDGAVWADGEPFPPEMVAGSENASN